MNNVNTITAIDAATQTEMGFFHPDPVLALSFIKAEQTRQMTAWGCMSTREKRAFVAAEIRRGKHHWMWGNWCVRYFPLDESFNMFLCEQDPRTESGDASYCPQCLGHNIAGGEVSIEGKNAIQEMDCSDCGLAWREIYSLADAVSCKEVA